MNILALGDPKDDKKNLNWLTEFDDITDVERLIAMYKKSKAYNGEEFVIFNLRKYANERFNSLDNKFNYGVKMGVDLNG